MKPLKSSQIRELWINFWLQKKHHLLASASLVPINDNSLLWINSGVAALKPYFDGRETPPSKRLVNSQKCLRTNDIENVGFTARHHTLFEMLGNFSIGDYFKKEAVIWAWEFLTSKEWLDIPADKLYITVYKEDQETIDIWKNEIKLSSDRIILGDRETNFWDMGQGPCGPNTEIFYDRGEEWDIKNQGLNLLINNIENDRYLEIWNIVFSQYNNDGNDNYTDLPRKNIDTGAGLERLACVLQNTITNFETDLFLPIIQACQKFTSYHYQPNNIFQLTNEQTKINIAFRIISDHIRAITFAIADGTFPSNKERGYIIRRLIRRSIVYGHKLNIEKPFLHHLVVYVVNIMGDFYHNLKEKENIIIEAVKKEETNFFIKLKQGYNLLQNIIANEKQVSAKSAFKLYDTFGFPIELTTELAKTYNLTIDMSEFAKLLQEQQERSRINRTEKNIVAMNLQNKFLLDLKTESKFIGYETETNPQAKVVAIFDENDSLKEITNETANIILDATPFYAEKGGQSYDEGTISNETMTGEVINVQLAPNKQHLHQVKILGTLKVNDIVNAEINHEKRYYAMKNHSGTHLLHAAIRNVLGDTAMQIGSFNNFQYLRLDISYNDNISNEKIATINTLVNKWIKQNDIREIYITSYEEAIKMNAIAFFNEKYDEKVRVVKFGNYSIELCGGTHVKQTQDIEQLLITSVDSKGVGVYRFHALTSKKTINEFLNNELGQWKNQAKELKNKYNSSIYESSEFIEESKRLMAIQDINISNWKKIKNEFNNLHNIFKKWQKAAENAIILKQKQAYQNLEIKAGKNYDLLVHHFINIIPKTLKELATSYCQNNDNLIVIFTSENNGKQLLLVGVGKNLIKTNKTNALKVLKYLTNKTNGQGGGNIDIAQGGFSNVLTMKNLLEKLLKGELNLCNISD